MVTTISNSALEAICKRVFNGLKEKTWAEVEDDEWIDDSLVDEKDEDYVNDYKDGVSITEIKVQLISKISNALIEKAKNNTELCVINLAAQEKMGVDYITFNYVIVPPEDIISLSSISLKKIQIEAEKIRDDIFAKLDSYNAVNDASVKNNIGKYYKREFLFDISEYSELCSIVESDNEFGKILVTFFAEHKHKAKINKMLEIIKQFYGNDKYRIAKKFYETHLSFGKKIFEKQQKIANQKNKNVQYDTIADIIRKPLVEQIEPQCNRWLSLVRKAGYRISNNNKKDIFNSAVNSKNLLDVNGYATGLYFNSMYQRAQHDDHLVKAWVLFFNNSAKKNGMDKIYPIVEENNEKTKVKPNVPQTVIAEPKITYLLNQDTVTKLNEYDIKGTVNEGWLEKAGAPRFFVQINTILYSVVLNSEKETINITNGTETVIIDKSEQLESLTGDTRAIICFVLFLGTRKSAHKSAFRHHSEVISGTFEVSVGRTINVLNHNDKRAKNVFARGSIKARKSPKPHVRAGYYRMQPCGKNRKLRKKIYVDTVFVNPRENLEDLLIIKVE